MDSFAFPGWIDCRPTSNYIDSSCQCRSWNDHKVCAGFNIISVGFPAIMLSGILIVLVALPGIVQRIDLFWRDGFRVFSNFLGGP